LLGVWCSDTGGNLSATKGVKANVKPAIIASIMKMGVKVFIISMLIN